MDPRLKAGGVAVIVGFSVGAVSWSVAGGKATRTSIAAVDERLSAVQTRIRPGLAGSSDSLGQILARPLFAMPAGQVEFKAIAIRLLGLVRTPYRTAALLSFDGGAPEWWTPGQERGGVALERVTASTASVSTPLGPVEVGLGSSSASGASPKDAAPAGLRGPPPPASAPGAG